jgi:hypothetical protein
MKYLDMGKRETKEEENKRKILRWLYKDGYYGQDM